MDCGILKKVMKGQIVGLLTPMIFTAAAYGSDCRMAEKEARFQESRISADKGLISG